MNREALLRAVLIQDPATDWAKLPLDAKEGFILSRIDGTCNVATLAAICGVSEADIVACAEKLVRLKAVTFKAAKAATAAKTPDKAPVAAADPPPEVLSFPEVALDLPPEPAAPVKTRPMEKVDLPDEQQERIFRLFDALGQLNHYDLLKLPRMAGASEVKPAYYAFSKEYHPDRFYGKTLGSYKGMLEVIFKAGKTAYEALSDAQSRARYDKTLPKEAPVVLNPTLNDNEAKRAALELHRQKILDERKSRQKNPFQEQVDKARQHAQEAEALFKSGDIVGAVAKFSLALAFDPLNEDYQRRHQELAPVANERRAQQLADAAAAEQKTGNFAGAAQLFRSASETLPGNGAYAHRAAQLFFDQGVELALARQLGEAAVEKATRNPEYRFTLAKIYDKVGERAKARDALNLALELGLDDPEAKKLSKRLK